MSDFSMVEPVRGVNERRMNTKLDVIENGRQNFPDRVVEVFQRAGYDINFVPQPVLGEAEEVVQKHDMQGNFQSGQLMKT